MGRAVGEGLKTYYKAKIEELEILARDKQHNLRRLEAQRNELNTKGRLLLRVFAVTITRPCSVTYCLLRVATQDCSDFYVPGLLRCFGSALCE